LDIQKPTLVPEEFGPLQGVRILSTGTIIAQPFAAALAADMGAEVIHVEQPRDGDVWRKLGRPIPVDDTTTVSTTWVQEHRNTFCVTLDLSSAQGKEMFLELVSKSDIWMESSKAGTYDKWGLDDATVLAVNPKLVITHVSGYGQTGHPDYLGRASYDVVGQAFGGMMHLNGSPEPQPPMTAVPLSADYITALFCMWSSLAGYIHAQRTGRGQVIDLAQYEAVHQILSGTMMAYYELGINRERTGYKGSRIQPFDAYHARDGWVIIAAVGTVFDKLCLILGLDPADPKWITAHNDAASVDGAEFDAVISGWVEERSIKVVEEIMNASQVACCPVMSAKDMDENPHYQARDMHIEWEDEQLGRKVKGVGFTPKFSETPGKVWRGSVGLGHDNDQVYHHYLGLEPEDLQVLREQGII
jgi:crotonobetainyl-CoA:carnitine CoA-transferase CaiB-like acyl-CoA transferase